MWGGARNMYNSHLSFYDAVETNKDTLLGGNLKSKNK